MDSSDLAGCSLFNENTLSAEELLKYRKSTDRSLPNIGGPKTYGFSGSWLEEKQVDCLLHERLELLSEPRHAKLSDLVQGEWRPELKKVVITKTKSKLFNHMGVRVKHATHLYPEEALFSMEMCALEVLYNKVPLSLQEAYAVLLPEPQKLRRYQVYSHLSRLGYTVVMHQGRFGSTGKTNTVPEKISVEEYSPEAQILKQSPKSSEVVCLDEPVNINSTILSDDDSVEILDDKAAANISHVKTQEEVGHVLEPVRSMSIDADSTNSESEVEMVDLPDNKSCCSETVIKSSEDELEDDIVVSRAVTKGLPFTVRNTSFLTAFLPSKYSSFTPSLSIYKRYADSSDFNVKIPVITIDEPDLKTTEVCDVESQSSEECSVEDKLPELCNLQEGSESYKEQVENISWVLKAEIPDKNFNSVTESLTKPFSETEKSSEENARSSICFPNLAGKEFVLLTSVQENLLPANVKLSRDIYKIKRESFLTPNNTKPAVHNYSNSNRNYCNRWSGNSDRGRRFNSRWSQPNSYSPRQQQYQTRSENYNSRNQDSHHRQHRTRWDSSDTMNERNDISKRLTNHSISSQHNANFKHMQSPRNIHHASNYTTSSSSKCDNPPQHYSSQNCSPSEYQCRFVIDRQEGHSSWDLNTQPCNPDTRQECSEPSLAQDQWLGSSSHILHPSFSQNPSAKFTHSHQNEQILDPSLIQSSPYKQSPFKNHRTTYFPFDPTTATSALHQQNQEHSNVGSADGVGDHDRNNSPQDQLTAGNHRVNVEKVDNSTKENVVEENEATTRRETPDVIMLTLPTDAKKFDKIILPSDCNFITLDLSDSYQEAVCSDKEKSAQSSTSSSDHVQENRDQDMRNLPSKDDVNENISEQNGTSHSSIQNADETANNLGHKTEEVSSAVTSVGFGDNNEHSNLSTANRPRRNSRWGEEGKTWKPRSRMFSEAGNWRHHAAFSSAHPRKRARRENWRDGEEYPTSIPKVGVQVHSWGHYKYILKSFSKMQDQGMGEEKVLYTGKVLPLTTRTDTDAIDEMMSKLRIIPQVNLTLGDECFRINTPNKNDKLEFDFDVYLPNVTFRLSSPSPPNLRLTVVSVDDPIPSLSPLVHLQQPLQDGIPLYFAVVGDDTPAFYGIHDVCLPDYTKTQS